MFYIEKQQRQRIKEIALLHIGPAGIVFAAFLGITIWSTIDAHRTITNDQTQVLSRDIEVTQTAIQNRLETYENILRGGVGLFGSTGSVTPDQWKAFIDAQQITARYPGTNGVGYAKVIPESDVSSEVASIQSLGTPDYSIFPAGDRPTYVPIEFVEPLTDQSKQAIGFDMYSDPARKLAMDSARDSGQATVTKIISLLQIRTSPSRQSGFVMYMPVYASGMAQASVTERQSDLVGFIYAVFQSHDVVYKTLGDSDKHFGFQLYDGIVSSNNLLYESTDYPRISKDSKNPLRVQSFKVNNQRWTLVATIDSGALGAGEQNRPMTVFWGGLLFSFFVAAFIYVLLLNRAQVLARKEERYVQEAKDELLALASHQLRTPATGVKQYIAMLREGYAGKISDMQRVYLDKAYESNERQLTTINEMLSVAKADAGKIELRTERFDLTKLIRDVTEEQTASIESRRQKLTVAIPRNKIYINADPQYIRMAVENIINNASKYTPEKGKLTVKLVDTRRSRIQIVVSDTGVGVSQKDFKLLFKKFSRIPNDLTNQVSGTGIGLYLAQKIVEAHKGTITFESEEMNGSVCTISLPSGKKSRNL